MTRQDLQRAVLRLQRFFLPRLAFKLYYKLAARLFAFDTRRRFPEIERIWLRRGQTRAGWVPGASDLDFAAVVRPADAKAQARFLRRFWARYALWKRLAPILGEIQLVDSSMLAALEDCPGLRLKEFLSSPRRAEELVSRWECLSEALFSCLNLLQQSYFSAQDAPDFGHKIAKGCLDTLRHAQACRFGQGGRALERLAFLTQLPASPLKEALARPERMEKLRARQACRAALRALDEACASFIDDVKAGQPASAAAIPDWEPSMSNSDLFAWRRRVRELEHPQFPRFHGLYYDGASRWHVVFDLEGDEPLDRAFDRLEKWHAEDPAFGAPPWLVSPAIFQALQWTPHLGSPFFHFALSPRLGPLELAGRRRSRYPLGAWAYRLQAKMTAGDFAAPPKELLGLGAAQCAAELALSLGLFGQDGWGGDNGYRLTFLYSRLISLALYLRRGLARDPDDLDGLLDAFRKELPEDHARVADNLEEALATPAGALNERPACECFYRHYAAYRFLLDGVLAALEPTARGDRREPTPLADRPSAAARPRP